MENTFHARAGLDVVVGASYDEYRITKAEEFDASVSPGVFERPKGGSDAFNWQSAVIWRYRDNAQLHASISDRGRFPTFFELYSTRFGTATPNPDLGPERATNFEIGWEMTIVRDARIGGAVFYNDVEDLIQTVVFARRLVAIGDPAVVDSIELTSTRLIAAVAATQLTCSRRSATSAARIS